MADELTLIKQLTIPVSVIVADATAIAKGTVMKIADPATFSASVAASDICGGVSLVEKIASDGTTQLAVCMGPGDWFKATASGSITVGDALATSGGGTPNRLVSFPGTLLSGAKVIGDSLETATDGQTFLFRLNMQQGPRT